VWMMTVVDIVQCVRISRLQRMGSAMIVVGRLVVDLPCWAINSAIVRVLGTRYSAAGQTAPGCLRPSPQGKPSHCDGRFF